MFDNSSQDSQDNSQKSFLTSAANDGAIIGLLMAAFSIFMMVGNNGFILPLLSFAIFIAVPYLMFRFLKRSYISSKFNATFSLLWMQGINTFICGGLIMAFAIFVYLRFVSPDFILDQITILIGMLREAGSADSIELADSLQSLADHNQLPTPISVAFSNMFMAVFTGSLLSAVISMIVRATTGKDTPTPPPYNAE